MNVRKTGEQKDSRWEQGSPSGRDKGVELELVSSQEILSPEEAFLLLKRYMKVCIPLFDDEGKLMLKYREDVANDREFLFDLYEKLEPYSREIRGYLTATEPSPWIRILDGFSLEGREPLRWNEREVNSIEYTINGVLGGFPEFWNFVLTFSRTAIRALHFYFGGRFWALTEDLPLPDFLMAINSLGIKNTDPVYRFTEKEILLIHFP